MDVSQGRCKSTDFCLDAPNKNWKVDKKSDELLNPPTEQMKNMFNLEENSWKLCAEGCYWKLNGKATLLDRRNELTFGTGYIKFAVNNEVIEWIECTQESFQTRFRNWFDWEVLWILFKKFNFATRTKVKVNRFKSLKKSLTALLEIKFPMLISIESKLVTYHHVVVVWREMVIDYESIFTYPLTEDSVRQRCGVITTFIRISSWYGIFPSKQIRKLSENGNIIDWGSREYYKPKIAVREYIFRK